MNRSLIRNRLRINNFSSYLSFNGNSEYVTINDSPSLNSNTFSWAFWLYKNAEAANFSRIIQKSNGTNAGFLILFDNSITKRPYFEVRNNAGSFSDCFGTMLPINTWRHYVYVFDGNYIYAYENGILVNKVNFIGTFQTSSNSLFFATKDGANNFGNFLFDEVRYYNAALTADQAKRLYFSGSDSLPLNLSGYWKFNEGSGTTANDSSGNGNTGTITSATYGTINAIMNNRQVITQIKTLQPNDNSISSNLSLWLKADANTYTDVGVTLATNGQSVQQWNDQSGNGNNAIQTTGGNKPTLVTNVLNGLPGLSFSNANNSFMQCADSPSLNPAKMTLFAVVVPKNILSGSQGILCKDSGSLSNPPYDLFIGTSPQRAPAFQINSASNSNKTVNAGSMQSMEPYIVESTFDGSNMKAYLNSILLGTTAQTDIGVTVSTLNIGQQKNAFTTRAWDGYICEIIMYSTNLSDSQRNSIEKYLCNKWGINISGIRGGVNNTRTKVLSGNENYLTDTFQGTNGTFINSHTPDTIIGSGTWSQTAGTSFWIQSNHLEADRMTDGDLATINVGLSDITLTGVVIPFGDGTNRSYPGLVFRYVNSSNFWYVYPDTDNGYIRMYKVVAGVSTKMIDYTVSLVSGTQYTIAVKCKGRNITLFVGGVEIVTVVDTFNQTATSVGVRYGKSNNPTTSAKWLSLMVNPFSGLVLDWPLFTEYSGNPVIPQGTTGQWDSKDVNNPNVIWDPVNRNWLMYYSGYDGDGDRIQDFGLASASQLLGTWTKNAGNPVVTSNGEDGIYAWNGGIIFYNNQYYNYYVSNNGQKIRLITSPDLSTWTRQGLVIDAGASGSWDDGYVFDPFVRIREDGVIEMWYAGQNAGQTARGLGRATSTDGINFVKDPNNPIITTPLWANVFSNLGEPAVYVPPGKEDREMMISFDSAWVTGNRFISQAITIDGGRTWHYRTGALMNQASGWESVQVFDNFIMVNNNIMYLFHSGANTVGTALNLNIQIGVATYIPRRLDTLIVSQ